ncbi:MAG TPA: radical SAM protein [Bacteroidia bacterium]|nr:radical SAM protein [Bacteroidia bacterium]
MQKIISKTILNKTKHPPGKRDAWFLDDYTINPYSGCSFNCLYCYIRGSKYGEHMEEKLSVKTNAVELLEKQLHLRAKKGQHGIIVMSSATDPYLQAEKETGLTRQLLEVILKHKFPVHIITKSDLVTRDFDLLEQIDRTAILPADLRETLKHGTIITFSFTTVDDAISKIFELGATSPAERLHAHEAAVKNNFLSGISMMPLLPHITDTTASLDAMFTAFKNAGSHYVMPATITLFGNGTSDSKTLVFRAIDKHYPHLSEKYRKLFANGSELPRFYNEAFGRKANR